MFVLFRIAELRGCGVGPEDLPSMFRALGSVLSTENKHRIKTKTFGSGKHLETKTTSLASHTSLPRDDCTWKMI